MSESPRTDALLADMRFDPWRLRLERLAKHAIELEIELQQANDAYVAVRDIFRIKDRQC